jgi:pyruvate/2-oxoglutarate/acetoin dehydrogenase E1 component
MNLRGRTTELANMYRSELCRAMTLLSDAGALFVGQAVVSAGTAMTGTLQHVPVGRRLEFPVAENCQLGFCTGLAIAGGLPVAIFPRINFMLEAVSQLVQHLDAIPRFSDYRPRVIIRTAIATDKPLDPGPQHVGNYVPAFRAMLKTIHVCELLHAEMIVPCYQAALRREGSSLLVEHLGLYDA